MVQPSSSTTVQYPYIGSLMYEYMMSDDKFIATDVLPYSSQTDETGYIPVIAREDILKIGDSDGSRAPGSGYAREDYEWEQKSYTTVEYGWEMPLDDSRVRSTAQTAKFDAREVAARLIMNRLMLRREKRVADLLFNASTFSGYTSAVTNEWDDATNGVPRSDVQTAKTNIYNNTGMEANGIIVSRTTFWDIVVTADFKSWVQYTLGVEALGKDEATQKALVAQYLGLDYVFVGKARYDSAKKGATFSGANIWDYEYALIGKFATAGTPIDEPAVGRQILWTTDSPTPAVVEGYREDAVRGEVVRVRHHQDEVVFFPECGYLFSNIHS